MGQYRRTARQSGRSTIWAKANNGRAANAQRQKVSSTGVIDVTAACPTTKFPDQKSVARTRKMEALGDVFTARIYTRDGG